MRGMRRSGLFRLLLIFALLFAQHGAYAHGIAHILAERSQDQSLPQDKHCDLCEIYAQIGSAIGSCGIQVALASSFEETCPTDPISFHAVAFAAFTARAPPYSA